ncbi:MAG TPA: hypothetical protein VEQ11_06355 [Chloroflexota bacterium]|nr:hypothetical protein [Chloroflexota bacterium]
MKTSDQRKSREWVRDPFLFGMALILLAFVTVTLAVTGRVFGDPALIGLAVVSVAPAFWLFYQRGQAMAGRQPNQRPRRR